MDPNATLQRIFDTLIQAEYEECFHACMDLQHWLNNGGFTPDGYDVNYLHGFLIVTKKAVKGFARHGVIGE